MTNNGTVSAGQVDRAILRSVSRSFYISIRLLPRRLREPVGLAYLLARATDTLADTGEITLALRRQALTSLAGAIRGDTVEGATDLDSFAVLQQNEAERNLIESVPKCLARLEQLNAADRGDVRLVLDKITQGQGMDLDSFGDANLPRALATAADLEKYTYLIAGCVGEFWTDLCFRYVDNFSGLPQEKMLQLARRYGAGLQLINILRDAHADLRAGRCYFPEDELRAIGIAPSEILAQPARFETVAQKWREAAEQGLEAGMEYCRAIRHRRVRAATALPALIGARTIAALRAAGPRALQEKIKIPRQEVRGMVAAVAVTLAARRNLDEMFRRALGKSESSDRLAH